MSVVLVCLPKQILVPVYCTLSRSRFALLSATPNWDLVRGLRLARGAGNEGVRETNPTQQKHIQTGRYSVPCNDLGAS